MEELLKQILTKLDGVDARLDDIETKVGKLDGMGVRLDNIENKVDKIDASQVRMENELTEKVRALFDARAVSLDYFASIKNTLARIENNQDSFRNMLYNLEGKQREQDRELRLLRVEQK